MKNRLFTIVAVVFLTFFSPAAWAIDNPIGSGTLPPTSAQTGLIRTPNPIDTSGNLLITGNVRRGKHFRGIIPYQATFDFVETPGSLLLGSSSLDSFLRDSAGVEDFGRYTGKLTPYYSPSRTVTTTRPGYSGVFRPPATKIDDRVADRFALPLRVGEQTLSGEDIAPVPFTSAIKAREDTILQKVPGWEPVGQPVSDSSFRPMSMTTQELEKVLAGEVKKYQQAGRLPPADTISRQRQEQIEQFRRDLKQVSDEAAELGQRLMAQNDSLQLSTKKKLGEDVPQQFQVQTPEQQTSEDEKIIEDGQIIDVYEQMKWQVDNFQKSLEAQHAETEKQTEGADEGGREPDEESSLLEGIFEVDLSVRAKAILGEHKTFASFSNDKFNQHLMAAEGYLKQGRYYRAADAYTLASIYKPDDPLPYAGKGHALFAAGEYMSSALFLSRALEIFPEYIRFSIDIEAMLGDKDKLETRIVDIKQWLAMSDAPELQFLLGYVYYQMNRIELAKGVIDAACQKMPESPAVITLKEAIDEAIKSY